MYLLNMEWIIMDRIEKCLAHLLLISFFSFLNCMTRWCLKVNGKKDIWQWQQLVLQILVLLRLDYKIFHFKLLALYVLKYSLSEVQVCLVGVPAAFFCSEAYV